MKFNDLIKALSRINNELREQATRSVNVSLTLRNWFFGFYIVEFEQNGKDRADYDKALLAEIAAEMKTQSIPNSNERELRRYRQFYTAYPKAGSLIINNVNIRGLMPPEFIDKKVLIQIRGLANPGFNIPDSHYMRLFNDISYTHFKELIRLDDPLKRLFYEMETVKNTWSVNELKRQIGSLLFERTGLSKNKEKLLLSLSGKIQEPQSRDIIHDPYIFEFLGLKPREVFQEKDLEQALLDNLSQFLLELGKGFCFEARQKRMLIDNEHHFVDLVFYNRLLHCNILIDLLCGAPHNKSYVAKSVMCC